MYVHRLGAWQFMADMPYSVVSLPMMWHIFLVLYTNVAASVPDQVCDVEAIKRKLRGEIVILFLIRGRIGEHLLHKILVCL